MVFFQNKFLGYSILIFVFIKWSTVYQIVFLIRIVICEVSIFISYNLRVMGFWKAIHFWVWFKFQNYTPLLSAYGIHSGVSWTHFNNILLLSAIPSSILRQYHAGAKTRTRILQSILLWSRISALPQGNFNWYYTQILL